MDLLSLGLPSKQADQREAGFTANKGVTAVQFSMQLSINGDGAKDALGSPILRQWQRVAAALLWLVLGGSASAQAPPSASPAATPTELVAAESWKIDHPTHHVQGLCVDANFFWISSVDKQQREGWIYRVDRKSLIVVGQRKLVAGTQYHPGGMQLRDGEIWVPLAEYRPLSSATVLCLDAMTLETKASFEASDHLGAVAIDSRGNIFAANWNAKRIYVFDKTGKQLEPFENPTGVAFQDMHALDHFLFAAGTTRLEPGPTAVIDVIDLDSKRARHRYLLRGHPAAKEVSFCREGFAMFGTDLFLLPEDGPNTRVYRFALPVRSDVPEDFENEVWENREKAPGG